MPRNPTLKLMNFRCPRYLQEEFDDIIDRKYLTRTSVLLNLIEGYIRKEREFTQNQTIEMPQKTKITSDNFTDDRSIFLNY